MNITKINTIKFNNMNIEAPIGPGRQIPFRGNNDVQNPITGNTDKTDINFENSIYASNPKSNLSFFGKMVSEIKDFVELENTDLLKYNMDSLNYLA